jgi:hypothetical protein
MPIDASSYTRQLRLATQQTATVVGNPNKFRAPTRDTFYNPNRAVKNTAILSVLRAPPVKNTIAKTGTK